LHITNCIWRKLSETLLF